MDIENYFKEGYYIGKTEEIFDDIELFKKYAKEICEEGEDINTRFSKGFRYRFEYPFSEKDNAPHVVTSLQEIKEREEHLEKNGYKTIQRWWERGLNMEVKDKVYSDFFRDSVDKFITKLYPQLIDNATHGDSITIYSDGDFLERHTDGRHEERYCVVLIYLSEKNDYIDGGGKLIVGKNEKDLKEVIPTNDTFVIMDFTKHDIIHEVEKVKNGFHRNTYITFVHNEEMWFKKQLDRGNVNVNHLQQFNKRAFDKLFPKNNIL
jgi:hypothetical protein